MPPGVNIHDQPNTCLYERILGFGIIKLSLTILAIVGEVEQFRQDAQIIAALLHPNIVCVLDFGVEEGTPYTHDQKLIHRDIKPENILLKSFKVLLSRRAELLSNVVDWRHESFC
ncbi:MAG TPA: hypothetical protein VH540_01140 [Ktedonobacterales bacterium]|jgi:serine/threonine protein kinase